MKITILSLGTRGDVEPLIALSIGLKNAGHEVVLGADCNFEALIKKWGITFAQLKLDLKAYLNTQEGKEAMANGEKNSNSKKDQRVFDTMIWPMLDSCWKASQNADLLIYDTMLVAAYHIAEKLNIPAIMTSVMPNMTATKEFPLIGAAKFFPGKIGNKSSYLLYRYSWWKSHNNINRWCESTLQMKRPRFMQYDVRDGEKVPTIYSYSDLICPTPADWPGTTIASGYWMLKETNTWQPPEGLEDFLATGSVPLYVGFGSMVCGDPDEMTDKVLAAVAQTGQRAIICTGWGGLVKKQAGDNFFFLEEVAHSWLFPKVSAVIHHGGAGTTSAGLLWGKPTVICPLVTDQFFWGDIIYRRGFGSRPVPQAGLTSDALAAAIKDVMAADVIERVRKVSLLLSQENGIESAVKFIEHQFIEHQFIEQESTGFKNTGVNR